MKHEQGFTLVEILTASTISLIVMVIALSTYIMLLEYIPDTAAQAVMQSKIRLGIDKIARDLRHASIITCAPSGNSLTLTFDPSKMGQEGDLWSCRYRLVGDQILYSPDGSSDNETVLMEHVSLDPGDTLFQYNGGSKLATIDIKTVKTGINIEQDAHLTTVVKVRNAY